MILYHKIRTLMLICQKLTRLVLMSIHQAQLPILQVQPLIRRAQPKPWINWLAQIKQLIILWLPGLAILLLATLSLCQSTVPKWNLLLKRKANGRLICQVMLISPLRTSLWIPKPPIYKPWLWGRFGQFDEGALWGNFQTLHKFSLHYISTPL